MIPAIAALLARQHDDGPVGAQDVEHAYSERVARSGTKALPS